MCIPSGRGDARAVPWRTRGRSREAGWNSATKRGPYWSMSALAHFQSAYWAGLVFSQYPHRPQWYLVHVQCRQCLTDFTSVNVDLPKTRWETRESETVSLLCSYQSHTHLTHFQTMNRNEFQLHYRSVASISFIRMYQRQAVSRP